MNKAYRKKNDGTNSDRVTSALPQVCSMGISMWDPVYAERFHPSGTHEFIQIMEGETVMHVGQKRVQALRSDVLILRKGTLHRDEFLREPTFQAFLASFNWDGYDAVVPKDINAKLVKIPAGEKQKIREMVMEMYALFRGDRPFARDMVNASFYKVLLYCLGAVKTGQEYMMRRKPALDKRRAIIEEAKQYIRNNFNHPIALADIAKHLKLSEYYVSHIFSKETGFTFPSYVTQIRMEQAITLLRDLANTVSEVAYRVGYDNPGYFGKVFYKHFNRTPSQYQAHALAYSRRKRSGGSVKL